MKPKLISLLLTIALSTFSFSHLPCHADTPVTAILGALEEEIENIDANLLNREERVIEGVNFSTGEINGRKVVVARSGVGKVNAAMTATLLIEHFNPSEIISTGIAGAINPELLPGDIVIATKTAYHDMGTLNENGIVISRDVKNPITGAKNPAFFPSHLRLLNLAWTVAADFDLKASMDGKTGKLPRIKGGVIVSGDIFVSSESKKKQLRKDFMADAVEMEAAAVAQVCWQMGKPYIAIRSISDLANTNADKDFGRLHSTASDNSGRFALEIIKLLAR